MNSKTPLHEASLSHDGVVKYQGTVMECLRRARILYALDPDACVVIRKWIEGRNRLT